MNLQHFRNLLVAGPLTGTDHYLAQWFHQHLAYPLDRVVLAMSEPGSALWIGCILLACFLYVAWKRHWNGLLSIVLIVPGGLLINSAIKILVHRHRPLATSSIAHWDGYSFPSGHTIGATLLYGMLIIALLPIIKRRRWKALAIVAGSLLVVLVGFSRIALGAHYLTDVLGAIILGLAWLAICKTGIWQVRRHQRRRVVKFQRAYRIQRRQECLPLAA